MKPLGHVRWGIVGCGDVCEVKSGPALYQTPHSSLEIVMRRDAERARDFARRHGVARSTNDARAVIDDARVDAVYVATPPGTHAEYALLSARAGKPCYVEKPMARSAAECRAMLEASEAAGVPLFVAYYRRALPRFTAVKALIEGNELGAVHTLRHRFERQRPAGPAQGWREQPEHSGGGLFLDLGSHVLDLMDWLLGPAELVSAQAARQSPALVPEAPVEEQVRYELRFGSGARGEGYYDFRAAANIDRFEVIGDRGALALSVFGSEPLELSSGAERRRLDVKQPEHVHAPLVESIVGELTGSGARCPSRGDSALRTSELIDRILAPYYGGRDDAFWARAETWPGA